MAEELRVSSHEGGFQKVKRISRRILLPDRELLAWGPQASWKCTAVFFEAQQGTEK